MIDLLDKFLAYINGKNKLKLNKQTISIIAFFGLLIIYVDFSFIITPQLNGIRTVTPKIIKLKKDLDNLARDLSLMEEAKKGPIKKQKQEGTAKFKQIISEDGIPVLLKEMADLANKNKVKIMQINTQSGAKAQEETIAGGKFLPITITLNLSCNYHSLGSFINALESAQTFMSVEDMQIARDQKDYLQQKVKLAIDTYAKK